VESGLVPFSRADFLDQIEDESGPLIFISQAEHHFPL
jgi:hypothetical protein